VPRNALAFVGVCLVWRVFVRREAPHSDVASPPEATPAPAALPDALLVSKGADQCLVAVDRIERVSAAGNYVEVHAAGQMYLLRATLSQLEARLPPGRFVRIHRSHIVRVAEIERIRVRRSSSGSVTLRDGSTLPMSKRYRAALQPLREPAP
jgi:DNA-binding LytR/AlgR family response regulator